MGLKDASSPFSVSPGRQKNVFFRKGLFLGVFFENFAQKSPLFNMGKRFLSSSEIFLQNSKKMARALTYWGVFSRDCVMYMYEAHI